MGFFADFFVFRKKVNAERQDKAARAAIAKAFNDRFTFCEPYRPKANAPAKVEGSGDTDLDHFFFNDQAWMCPACNAIHRTIGRSIWTGTHFPACCDHPEGHRCNENIRTRS